MVAGPLQRCGKCVAWIRGRMAGVDRRPKALMGNGGRWGKLEDGLMVIYGVDIVRLTRSGPAEAPTGATVPIH